MVFADNFVYSFGKTPASPDPSGSIELFMTYDKSVDKLHLTFNGRISTEQKKNRILKA